MEVVEVMRARLGVRDEAVTIPSLFLLEMLIKNCGMRFAQVVAANKGIFTQLENALQVSLPQSAGHCPAGWPRASALQGTPTSANVNSPALRPSEPRSGCSGASAPRSQARSERLTRRWS